MRNFPSVMLLAPFPTLLGLVVSGVLSGWQVALGIAEPVFLTGADFIRNRPTLTAL